MALIAACALSSANAQNNDAAAPPESSPIPNPESRIPALEISLLTIGPGPIFWERFGHNAIVVRDRDAGTAIAYNYGIFDFEQKNFLENFARGNMRYRIAADRLDDDIEMYREESRSIVEQRLDFTPAEAMKLRDFLRWNIRPENAFYRYDYYLANCSTRVRDALDAALGGAIRRDTEGRSSGYTYRMDSLRLMAANPLLMLGIDLGLGPYADQRIDYWQESFVPAVFSRALREVRVASENGTTRPLVSGESTIERGTIPEPPDLPPDLRIPFLIAGIAIALAWYALARSRSRTVRSPAALFALAFELFCGIGGLVLLFLWLGTAHVSAWRNENLLLLNPLCLALIPMAATLLRAKPKCTRRATIIAAIVALLAAFALFSKILPWFA
ncbi:MAG TPA: DUF4105 domain-containing protein, partial [Rhodanobacteraceae bacterium]|nr:DUF4105 domain-containing protein [Rhodanobacteraceae bacterium]